MGAAPVCSSRVHIASPKCIAESSMPEGWDLRGWVAGRSPTRADQGKVERKKNGPVVSFRFLGAGGAQTWHWPVRNDKRSLREAFTTGQARRLLGMLGECTDRSRGKLRCSRRARTDHAVCGTVRVPIPQHTRQTRSRSRQPPSERYAEQAEVDEHSELGLVPPRHTAYPAGDDPRAFGFAGGTRGGERNSQTCGAQPQHRVSTGEHQRICASFRFTAD